jgi:hypothetical protein
MKLKLLTATLLIPLLFTLAASAYALPPCPDKTGDWDNCIGTLALANGNKYVGELKDNKRTVKGTYTWINGAKYVGEFKDDKKRGEGTKGTFTWADGEKYVGEFKDSKRHGKGTMTYASGDTYVGEWKDGKRHGNATYTWANGKVKSGIYADNKYLYESVESARSECAKEAGKAGTEYAAKQIEKTCLAEKQLELEPEPKSKSWFDWYKKRDCTK